MRPYLLKTILFSAILFLCFTAKAQQIPAGSGSVSGKLVDAANNQPLSFASVAIIRKSDSKQVSGMQTDIDGNFKLSNLADGLYMLRATYTGYLTYTRDSINVRPSKRSFQFGALKIHPAKGVLKEVTISAQRSQISLGIDKKSFSVAESLVSEGGSATDLLANVPSIQVDVDGNISLRGSTSVKVLINGKPSTLTGGSLTDILQSIPASAIETIEVITNPSSKYDAEGQSGIINIVLKRNAQLGFSGSAALTGGTQNTFNSSLNLAYKTQKFNIYGNYSYRKADRISNGFSDKTSTETGTVQLTNQVTDQKFTVGGQNIRSGIDFFLTPKTTLSFSDNINLRTNDRLQTGGTNIISNGSPFQLQNQDNTSNGTGTNLDFDLDFEHKFAKKLEVLTANAGYSEDRSNTFDYLNTSTTNYTIPNNPPSLVNDDKLGKQRNVNLQADYTLPLTNGQFETGFRVTLNRTDNNYLADTSNWATGIFVYSPVLSNDFIYKQNVNAAYANYQHTFGNFGIQGGVRAEDANINTQLTSEGIITPYKQDYFRLYPSLFLTQKINDNQTIQLSYTRRVTRPQDRQLSPFLDVSNKQNFQQGNPDLLPEDTHSVELSYIDYWKTLTLTSSLYYRRTNDNIQQIVTPYTPNNLDTTLTKFENIKSASNAGYELIAKVSPSAAVDLTTNVNVYYHQIDGDAAYNIVGSAGYSWNGNLTASIKPSKTFRFQLRGDYQGAQVTPQGSSRARYGLDGGARYNITKALALSVNSRDIFNTRKYISETYINNGVIISDQTSQRRFATRSVLFTISYHIGQTPEQMMEKQREKEKAKEDKEKDKDKTKTPDPDSQDDDDLTTPPPANGTNGTTNGTGGTGHGGTNQPPVIKQQ